MAERSEVCSSSNGSGDAAAVAAAAAAAAASMSTSVDTNSASTVSLRDAFHLMSQVLLSMQEAMVCIDQKTDRTDEAVEAIASGLRVQGARLEGVEQRLGSVEWYLRQRCVMGTPFTKSEGQLVRPSPPLATPPRPPSEARARTVQVSRASSPVCLSSPPSPLPPTPPPASQLATPDTPGRDLGGRSQSERRIPNAPNADVLANLAALNSAIKRATEKKAKCARSPEREPPKSGDTAAGGRAEGQGRSSPRTSSRKHQCLVFTSLTEQPRSHVTERSLSPTSLSRCSQSSRASARSITSTTPVSPSTNFTSCPPSPSAPPPPSPSSWTKLTLLQPSLQKLHVPLPSPPPPPPPAPPQQSSGRAWRSSSTSAASASTVSASRRRSGRKARVRTACTVDQRPHKSAKAMAKAATAGGLYTLRPARKTEVQVGRALLAAAEAGKTAEVRRLVAKGFDVNFCNASKWTPLHKAAMRAHSQMVALLLNKGANIHARTSFGFTALHLAAYGDHSGRCLKILIDGGSDVNCKNHFGRTPLHYAAENGNEEAIRALLCVGAQRRVKDNLGKMAVDLAREVHRSALSAASRPGSKCTGFLRS